VWGPEGPLFGEAPLPYHDASSHPTGTGELRSQEAGEPAMRTKYRATPLFVTALAVVAAGAVVLFSVVIQYNTRLHNPTQSIRPRRPSNRSHVITLPDSARSTRVPNSSSESSERPTSQSIPLFIAGGDSSGSGQFGRQNDAGVAPSTSAGNIAELPGAGIVSGGPADPVGQPTGSQGTGAVRAGDGSQGIANRGPNSGQSITGASAIEAAAGPLGPRFGNHGNRGNGAAFGNGDDAGDGRP
jgi:hypothetical protein